MSPTSPSTVQPSSHASPSANDDLPTLLLQMQETISQIHTTITTLQPPSSSSSSSPHGAPFPATAEEHAKLTDLATRRDSAIRSLLTAFSAESEFLSQKRRVEREEILERRRAEDEELQRRRREEDQEWEEKLRQEDEERERTLEQEKGEVERETEELMGEIERGWERRWEEGRGVLRGLEGRRKELNRLIEEKLQAHTETPLPLNSRAIREARKTSSTAQVLESEQQTSQAQETAETNEEVTETKTTTERGFLPAAAFENAPPDLDRDYMPDAESHQEEEETLTRDVPTVEEPGLAIHLREKMASMSMDDLLNEPDELSVAAPVPVASRPTSPVARTLSAVETEERTNADNAALDSDPITVSEELYDVHERHLEIETTAHTNIDTITKTSLVDVEFQGLPIRSQRMDEDLHLAEFAEFEEEEDEEQDEGEHCGVPVENGGSADTVVERAASGTEEFRGRHDSLGIIHPPLTSSDEVDRGVVEETATRGPASPQESETSDYTPYAQTTPASPTTAITVVAQEHVTETAIAEPATTSEGTSEAIPIMPMPQQEQDDIDTIIPSDNADAHSISTIASQRGSYSDINELAYPPTSPTAAKAEEEDDDADFVAEQCWQQDGEEVQMRRALEGEGEGEVSLSEEVLPDEDAALDEELLRGFTTGPDEDDSVETAQGCITMAVAEVEDEWEREREQEEEHEREEEHEYEQQREQEEEDKEGGEQDYNGADAESVEKDVLEKEVLQGLVDDPVGPAHDTELEEEAVRARGVLEPCASQVDLAEGQGNDRTEKTEGYEEAESPIMGVEGVVEPPVTREESPSPGPGPQPEHEAESEPEPVPVEELVREQEEMGLGRPEPHDSAESEHDEAYTTPMQVLDMDHHPLDHSHVSHVVGVALTHSDAVHMQHTPIEEGDHEPAHYFVNQHHVPHSTDDFYTPAESPLRRYDHHQEHLDESYAPRGDHADDMEETHHEREVPVPDVSEDVEEDTQPRYQLYERPYTPSDFAPTPGLDASFHHVEHARGQDYVQGHDGQPEVVVTSEPDVAEEAHAEYHPQDAHADVHGDEQDTEDDEETGHQLERVPSHVEEVEEQESPGPSADDFPAVPGQAVANAEHAVQFGDVHHRDMEPGPEHYIDREDEVEDDRVQEAVSSESESESESEDFEGRSDIVLHHLDAIAEEEDEAVEAEVGDGVERRDMATEAETQAEALVEDEVEASFSDEDDIRSVPADESNVTLPNDVVQSDPEANAEAEAEAEDLTSHPQHAVVESAPADIHVYDTTTHSTLVRQETEGTEATEDYDADSSTEPSEPERIHEEDPDPRFSEEQPALDEAPDLKAGHATTEQEHASHEHQSDGDHTTHSQPGPEDDEYDPFRYSPPKKPTEGQVAPSTSTSTSPSPTLTIRCSSVKDTTSDSSAAHRDDDHVVNEANAETQEQQQQTAEHVEDDVRVDDIAEQSDVERPSDKVLRVENMMSVLSHEQAASSGRSLAEELEDASSGEEESDYEGCRHGHHYEEEGAQQEEQHDEQSVVGQVAVEDQAGRGYRSSDEEDETLADEEANRAYDHDGHSHNHDEVEAQPSQPCEPPVLQLIEPSDTENGDMESPSETSSISGHPHAVTREEDMGRDWSEVDQFLSESDSEDEPGQAAHVEEPDAAADTVAHAHPSVDVDLDAEVEAALETPATETSRAEVAAEVLDEQGHVGMHHSPELAQDPEPNPETASHDEHHDQDNRPSTPSEHQIQSQQPDAEDDNPINPPHHHDLPPLAIPATPPSPAHDSHHDAQDAHDAQSPEEEQDFVPRDVTNRPWRSDTVNTIATFATADTSNTVPTASSPQSARSGTTLSSGPSSPVEESASGQDPRIRDSTGANIGRPRGFTDGTDYSGGGYGGGYGDGTRDREPVPKVMEMWHQREASVSRRSEEVRLSGESGRSSSHNRGAPGSGHSGSGGGGSGSSGGGSSLFQRMRSVFEQSSSSSASAAPAAPCPTSINRVSMPSFFNKSHSSSPSQSASAFESTAAKQRPMSTSPYPAHSSYSDSRHRSAHTGNYTAPSASTQPVEAAVAEEAGEDSALLHQDPEVDDTSTSDGYDEEYEREKERERERRRERRRHEREREEWRERHGMVHAESGSSVSRYDYGEYRPE